MEVYGRVEERRRSRCGHTSPGEERGNETGKLVIAHGSSVEPAKRRQFAQLTSRRNPVGARDRRNLRST